MVNTTAAIMAIPSPLDSVRLVGDEEKHATLLYFGETSTLPDDAQEILVDSVRMASTMLFPFSEGIVEIARLGNDLPPALVAKLTNSDMEQIRNLFKMNPFVNSYLDNATQFPNFTPHVTLAYPDYTDEVILRVLSRPLHRVTFDRLAVWWNDERVEFKLSRESDDETTPMAHSIAEFLEQYGEEHVEHSGVKGMKWGVRKDQFGIGGIDLATGKQQVQAVSRGAVGRTVDAKAATKAHEDTYKVLDSIVGHLSNPDTAAAYSAKMQKHIPSDGFQSQKVVEAYRANASKTLTGLISSHLADQGVSGITVKTFPLGRNQFQYAIGDKKTVAAVLSDLDVKKLAHVDIDPVGVKMVVEFLWNEDGSANGYSIVEAPEHLTHDDLEHSGVKGMKWGVRKDERDLSPNDKALNLSQRTQVRVASAISAVSTAGITTNAAATLFQLQNRWERLKVVQAIINQAEHNPLLDDAGREALRTTKNQAIKGIVSSAIATTAISAAVGIVANRTAKAYFAPLHKVYGDSKPKINAEIKRLGKDLKNGTRPKMTSREYHAEVSKIVEKHMAKDLSNALSPFHELARSQLGTELNTKKLDISFSKLPNTNLVEKITIVTPTGLKLVKAIKIAQHADLEDDAPDLDLYFDYKFDKDGFIEEWSCPTIEIANELFEGTFDIQELMHSEGGRTVSDAVDDILAHSGVKGMKWGVRRKVDSTTGLVARTDSADQIHADRIASKIKKGGTSAVSNRDLKDFASRIQAEQEFNRANASQEAQKGQNFVTKFLKTQGNRQFNRVADKAVDIAVEKALLELGLQVTKKGKAGLGGVLKEIATRIQPKKKKGGNP